LLETVKEKDRLGKADVGGRITYVKQRALEGLDEFRAP